MEIIFEAWWGINVLVYRRYMHSIIILKQNQKKNKEKNSEIFSNDAWTYRSSSFAHSPDL